MIKIKNVAVIVQNNIQYESFKNAIDIMLEKNIKVDIYIPKHLQDDGFNVIFDDFYDTISKTNYNIYRESKNISYDILFTSYSVEQFENLKRKYTIKYMYGLITKPAFSLPLETNYIFDAFLCYGQHDASCLSNYGITFQIGNLKYLKTKNVRKKPSNKLNILYLPTYANESSLEIVGPKLVKLKSKYNIVIKPHHGTEYLKNKRETRRRTYIKNNFDTIYSSKDSLEKLINDCDIVITDMSGAVWDALCLNKPVISYYNKSNYKYGNYKSLLVQCINDNHIISISKNDNIEEKIKAALTLEQRKKDENLFASLFCCKNSETGDKFLESLKSIEEGAIEENYYLVHQQFKKRIKWYRDNVNILSKIIEDKNEEIRNASERIRYFEENILNSTSWKITKPLRKIKSFIKKIIQH